MKKSFVFILLVLLLAASLSAQPLLASQSVIVGLDLASSENGLVEVNLLSEQEFQAHIQSWERLANLSLWEYLEGFHQFVAVSQPHYLMQPYVLAECLWFQVAVFPRLQQVQQDGNLDKMMELNMVILPEVRQQVDDFLAGIGEGTVAIHPWSDAVLSFFQGMTQNPFTGLDGVLLEYGRLPQLPSLQMEHSFMPLDISYRNALLYHGLMDVQRLVAQFQAASADFSESARRQGEPALPPPVGGIDWNLVVSSQPLMYLLRHLPSGSPVYSFLLDYHSGETSASRCQDLYFQNRIIQQQWGLPLEKLLPDFSAAAVKAVDEDIFVLYCLPENDLQRLSSDLTSIQTMAPVYFSRSVSLLRRTSGAGTIAGKNGGALQWQ